MGKIYVNYEQLEQIQKRIISYRSVLQNSDVVIRKANRLIMENGEAESLTELEIKYGTILLQIKNYNSLLESLYNIIGQYIGKMTEIIQRKKGLTKIGVEDISWNLKSIKNALKAIQDVQSSVYVYGDSEFGKTEEEKAKMKKNYDSMYSIWEEVFPDMRLKMSGYRNTLQSYYDNQVLNYEKMDQAFQKKLKGLSKINLRAYVPNNISNQKLLQIFTDDFTKIKSITDEETEKRYKINEISWENHLKESKGISNRYIEVQKDFEDMYFGNYAVDFNGCEVIATYNALVALNHGKSPASFPDLLKYYENSGIMINGLFGTDPQAICNYFEQQDDYSADIYLDVEDFKNKQKQYDVYIFTYYNQKDDITKQIHTVAVTKENGKYVAHNVGSIDSADSFETIEKDMEKKSKKIISVIGIDKE